MAPARPSVEIGVLLYPGVQMAAVHGLTDLFDIADRFAAERPVPNRPALAVGHWMVQGPGRREVHRVYAGGGEPSMSGEPSVLIVPPTLTRLPDPETCARIAAWLRRLHGRGARIVSVCSGAFLVAGTGLLDGRAVATHRRCAGALVETFPRVRVDTEARMIAHDDVLTAGGFMAWVDVGLMLVETILGPEVRAQTARFARFGDGSDGQGPSAARVAGQDHDDPAVLRAQTYIHVRDGHGVSLQALAAAATLGRRTLLRRFTRATGMTPMAYCRAVRLARGRELLEAGGRPLKDIAASLGYGDQSSFARAFRQVYGVAPGVFRESSGAG
jgi:transcriptional regulator GlxA family with amidase domain